MYVCNNSLDNLLGIVGIPLHPQLEDQKPPSDFLFPFPHIGEEMGKENQETFQANNREGLYQKLLVTPHKNMDLTGQLGQKLGQMVVTLDPLTWCFIAFRVISVPERVVGDEGLEPPTSCV